MRYPGRDAETFHAAHQEAFADHWDFTPRDFATWAKSNLEGDRFDPALWCVVRAGDEIAAGTICTGATYGGGFVHSLFTRRPWRRKGVGAALLHGAGRAQTGDRILDLEEEEIEDFGVILLADLVAELADALPVDLHAGIP